MRSSDCACREAADPSIKNGGNSSLSAGPLPFLCTENETYEVQGTKRSGLHRCQRDNKTIRHPLPFRAEGTQSKPTIIFRGQGTRLSRLEKEAWDPRFIVMFQKCNKYNLFISTFPS